MALKMKGLTDFRAGLDAAIDRGTFKAASFVADLAGQLSPVDEGDLQSSARVEPNAPNGGAVYEVKSGGVSGPNKFVDYAEYVEADQPFFDPAVRAIKLKEEVKAEVRALAARSKV